MQCQQCVGSVLTFVRFYGANIESCFISCKFFAIFFDISLDYVTFMGTVWPRGGRYGDGLPLTRETEEHKDIRYVCVSRLPREHKNISLHKKHIRPLRGCRPRTNVRVASRNIRADAVVLHIVTLRRQPLCPYVLMFFCLPR